MLYITQNISHWSVWSVLISIIIAYILASFNLTKPQFATAPPPPVTWATLETPEIAVPPPLGRTSVTWTPWRWETPPGCGRCRRSVSERPWRSKARVGLALDGLGAGLSVNTKIIKSQSIPYGYDGIYVNCWYCCLFVIIIDGIGWYWYITMDVHPRKKNNMYDRCWSIPMTLLAVFLWGLDIEVTEASSNNIKKLETSGTYQLVCVAKDGKISVSTVSTQLMGRSTNEFQDGKMEDWSRMIKAYRATKMLIIPIKPIKPIKPVRTVDGLTAKYIFWVRRCDS